MTMNNIKTLQQAITALRRGQVSPSELCKMCLKKVEKFKVLNAFITVTDEQANSMSMEADRRFQQFKTSSANEPAGLLGPIDGIPVAIKDNFCTKDIRTSCSSHMLKNYKPPYSATVVEKLINQGAVIVGKTNMDEFAMGCGSVDGVFGPVRNPWRYDFTTEGDDENDDWFISGGSSGGSAVAVATGMAFAALGSDTGGSVRNPACYTGVVGLKPTYGLVSRHGLIPLVNSLDVPAVFARGVDDVAIILNAISGHDPLDSTTVRRDNNNFINLPETVNIKNVRIGIPNEYYPPNLSPETAAAWNNVADLLENGGAQVSKVSLPHTQYSIVCYSVLCACEVASNMARYDGIEFGHRAEDERFTEALYAATRHKGFNEVVRGRILAGNFFLLNRNYEAFFKKAQQVRRLIADDFNRVFNDGIDVLLTPTLLGDAPKYSSFSKADSRTRTQEQDVFTQPVNMAGIPAINIPVTLSSNGLPIGLQLIGQSFKEEELLKVAKWIEQQVNFPELELDLEHLQSVEANS